MTDSNRHLIVVPIFHSKEDQGSLGSKIPDNREREKNVASFWKKTSEAVQGLPVDFSKLYVYQDGLPITDPMIVQKCIEEGRSPNYGLLRILQEKGAHIMGTENTNLLVEDYMFISAIVSAKTSVAKDVARQKYKDSYLRLLKARDAKIAERIKDTLPDGGIGILFIGKGHNVETILEGEMNITTLETYRPSSPEALRHVGSYGKERE